MLVLVLFFSLVFLVGIFSYWMVVTSEREDTVSLVKQVKAQAIGDGVCAELVSMVNRAKWQDRFYFAIGQKSLAEGADPGAQVSSYYFTHNDFPFRRQGPEYSSGDAKFIGVIKDLDAFAKTYRIYVEVIYRDHKLTMSWDKDYTEGLVGSLNHEGTAFNKSLELTESVDEDVTDRLLDKIKAIARDPARLNLSAEDAKILTELAQSRGSFAQPMDGLDVNGLPIPDGKAASKNLNDWRTNLWDRAQESATAKNASQTNDGW